MTSSEAGAMGPTRTIRRRALLAGTVVALAVGAAVLLAAPAGAADAGRLAIASPTAGQVTGPVVTLEVDAVGTGGPVRFTVSVDGTLAAADGLPAGAGTAQAVLTVSPGGRTNFTLRDLGNGAHHVTVAPLAAPGVSPGTVEFTVRGGTAGGASRSPVAFAIGILLFVAVWLLMQRRMRSADGRWGTPGGGRGGTGE